MNIRPEFISFCEKEGISLDHLDDYISWYKCWSNGYNTSLTLFAVWKDGECITAMGRNIKNELLREEE